MSTYLLINLMIIIVPLILSFERKILFYKKLINYWYSILIVSSAFLIWDVIATARGDWAFAKEHIIGISFFGLPIEEILFFITVPYACIFIFETVNLYLNDKKIKLNEYFVWNFSLIFILIALLNQSRNYTYTVMLFSSSSVLLIYFLDKNLLLSRNFWITIAITYVPFLIVNYILTSIPIVTYNQKAFSTIRITTIPLEDFFYSFSMISMWILFYNLSKKNNG
ncbi:MAG: lycopene cyclase domain-containing protein [Ignavibacterium sp.]|nr:lycopene cyclase domain-containing protein [Ignavibacterium sp.]MCX7611394.1 lycopene cyclase domain-containing protein [Ignavibacterium sp.]MDW8375721.1 lycopene cyclase domain-containing protein [Ignavibacteriales bacterium]